MFLFVGFSLIMIVIVFLLLRLRHWIELRGFRRRIRNADGHLYTLECIEILHRVPLTPRDREIHAQIDSGE